MINHRFPLSWYETAGFLATLVLPVGFLLLFTLAYLQMRYDHAVQEGGRALEKAIHIAIAEAQPDQLLFSHFTRAVALLLQNNFEPGSARLLRPLEPNIFPLQNMVFTRRGTSESPVWAIPQSRFVMQKLWSRVQSGDVSERNNTLFRSLFGETFYLDRFLGFEGVPFPVHQRTQRGLVLWRRGSAPGSGFIQCCLQMPTSPSCFVLHLKNTSLPAFWAMHNPLTREFFGKGRPLPGWRRLLREALASGNGNHISGRHLVRVQRHPEGFFILASSPDRLPDLPKAQALLGFLGFFSLSVAFFLYRRGHISLLHQWPIPVRVPFLFLLIGGAPLLLIAMLSTQALTKQEQRLIQEVHQQNLARLQRIDFTFDLAVEQTHAWFRSLRDYARRCALAGDYAPLDRLRHQLRWSRQCSQLEIWDFWGKHVWKAMFKDQSANMLGFFARHALRRHLSAPVSPLHPWLEELAGQAFFSPGMGFPEIIDQPDRIAHMAMDSYGLNWYWDCVSLPEPHRGLFFSMSQRRDWFNANFFQRLRFSRHRLIYDDTTKSWHPGKPRHPALQSLAIQALSGKKGLFEIIPRGTVRYLVSVFPSGRLPGSCFLTATPLKRLEKDLATYFSRFFFLGVVSLLVVLVFSRLFITSFLRPLREISRGIAALDCGNLQYRIPDLGTHEIGTIGTAFNEMVQELAQVETARQMQNRFLPDKSLAIPGYEIAFFNKPASDLGGDFCDVLSRTDHRYFIAIGDVTGHGIGSAILTAMTKAACQQSAVTGLPLVETLKHLNQVIFQTMKRKRMMTFFAGILTPGKPENHDSINPEGADTLEWSCVGHLFPLLYLPDGSVTSLDMRQFPIGSRAIIQPQTRQTAIPPGAQLIMFTDGFVESPDAQGIPYDFSRLQASLARHGHLPASRCLTNLLADFNAFVAPGPLADDATLLLLRRKAEAKVPASS
jgi:serine phosphatase RsbU (regulator of sigma subunit)